MRRIYFIICTCAVTLLLCPLGIKAQRPKVALVLGGGGAKGAAEVGVLKVLQRLNVPIDMVVGTSIGSIVGGLYCSGVDVSTLDRLFRSQEWLDLFTDRRSQLRGEAYSEQDGVEYVFGFPIRRKPALPPTGPAKSGQPATANPSQRGGSGIPLGLLKGDSITGLLARISGFTEPMDFDNLPTPFRCVAVDIKTMKEVVFAKGSLPLAMRASMSIPAVFQPLKMGDRLLVDGGVLNNLPVDVARRLGADIVIAVDLNQDAELQQEPKREWWEEMLGAIDLGEHVNWLVRRPDNERYRQNLRMANLVITPDIHEFDVASFNARAVNVMIDRGEQAATRKAKELMQIKLKTTILCYKTN